MKILTISMNNENGEKRRELLNYDYKQIVGVVGSDNDDPYVKEVKPKMNLRYNALDKTINGFTGNFASHLKALDYITKNKLNKVIITEDDSLQKDPLPSAEELGDEPILLSGQINHPNNWNMDKKWKREGKNKEIINTFKKGINEIDYEKFRWTQINALYIPKWEQARDLAEKVRSLKNYKGYDIFLSREKLIKKLYYPAVFNHHDKIGVSQVSQNPGVMVDYVRIGSAKSQAGLTYPKGSVS